MLFLTGRGDHAVVGPETSDPHGVPLAAACGFYASQPDPDWDSAPFGPFGYFFDGAPPAPDLPDARDVGPAGVPSLRLTPEDAAFCQFLEHDISAVVERHSTLSPPPGNDLRPLPRIMVLGTLANLRTGRLDLDSLYGGAALQGGFAEKSACHWLRHPRRRARLWLGAPDPTATATRPDVLRLGRLQDSGALSARDIVNLPDGLRRMFQGARVGKGGRRRTGLDRDRAILGDGRNASDAALRTLHVALARLHNVVVVSAPSLGGPTEDAADDCFAFARRLVRWHYQWLILNDLLPRLTCSTTLIQVLAERAPLYEVFLKQINGGMRTQMPLPLEVTGAVLPLLGDAGQISETLLRRGHRLNLASAQAACRAMALRGIVLPVAMPCDVGPHEATPQVLYVVQEARAQQGGRRLGALGSRLLSEMLAGLLLHDPDSFWNAPGYDPGTWHPRDGVRPGGQVIDSLSALRRLVAP